MTPALRSASIAICLPGIASRVKRAATSDTRLEPFVITTNWMTTRMKNTTRPTTIDPWMTKLPNASMTAPAEPVPRISRVDETFRPSRNSVAISNRLGKADRSSARVAPTAARSSSTEKAMLIVSNRSSSAGGIGMTMRATTNTIATENRVVPNLRDVMIPSRDSASVPVRCPWLRAGGEILGQSARRPPG